MANVDDYSAVVDLESYFSPSFFFFFFILSGKDEGDPCEGDQK